MKAKASAAPVFQIVFEAEPYAAKGQFIPGDFFRRKEGNLKAFLSRGMVGAGQAAAIEQMNLIDVGNADQGKGGVDRDLGPGLFKSLASGSFCGGFSVFHEACGQGPEANPWLNGSPAKKNASCPFGDAADDQARVFVVNPAAGRADLTGQIISGRYLIASGRTAVGAITNQGLGPRREREKFSILPGWGGTMPVVSAISLCTTASHVAKIADTTKSAGCSGRRKTARGSECF